MPSSIHEFDGLAGSDHLAQRLIYGVVWEEGVWLLLDSTASAAKPPEDGERRIRRLRGTLDANYRRAVDRPDARKS